MFQKYLVKPLVHVYYAMLLGYKYHFKKIFRPISQWILAKKRGEEKEIISTSNRVKCFLKEHSKFPPLVFMKDSLYDSIEFKEM